ncbi:hypothetical protein [Porphyromonas asaccharolytica]|jgi:hypothetical protein|uniref:hypothetical protein n=1 Tax=Porphyromonas asaccharolytica TaxID=28123 RepID=UPI00248F1D3F|nr:hypothetical protein [Porphyromonas asaccharolytica]
METKELKHSQESYIQRVLDIARQMPKVGSPDIHRQYDALKDISYGLWTATKGLQALQDLYGKNDLSSHFLDLAEALDGYRIIALTSSIESLEEMRRIIEIEMRKIKEQ